MLSQPLGERSDRKNASRILAALPVTCRSPQKTITCGSARDLQPPTYNYTPKRTQKTMKIDKENLLNSILESLDNLEYIKSADIPNIDLYMDQVTTFLDTRLRNLARNPGQDKVMTKTMINNYAKNDLLPPPVKKKYSKEHVLLLIFIYYYKGILSINDIQTLLRPITEKYFRKEGDFKLEQVYEEVFSLEKGQIEVLKKEIVEEFQRSEQTFADVGDEDRDFLQKFAFICMLSYDVYMKKMIIEKLIDEFAEEMTVREDSSQDTKK